MAKKSEFATRLGQSYNKWRSDMIAGGWAPSEASQAQFARWMDVSESSLSRWLNDSGTPESDSVHKLASKIGGWVYDLLGYPSMVPDEPHAKYVVSRWHQLSPEDRKAVAQMVANFIGDNKPQVITQN